MQPHSSTVQDMMGNAIAGATVTIRPLGQPGVLANLYHDKDGQASQTNPMTTDHYGHFRFYAPDGHYIVAQRWTYQGQVVDSQYPILLRDPNLASYVTSVNGIVPDGQGNVTVSIPEPVAGRTWDRWVTGTHVSATADSHASCFAMTPGGSLTLPPVSQIAHLPSYHLTVTSSVFDDQATAPVQLLVNSLDNDLPVTIDNQAGLTNHLILTHSQSSVVVFFDKDSGQTPAKPTWRVLHLSEYTALDKASVGELLTGATVDHYVAPDQVHHVIHDKVASHWGNNMNSSLTVPADGVYWLSFFGYLRDLGNGMNTFAGCQVTRNGQTIYTTLSKNIDWPDGNPPVSFSMVTQAQAGDVIQGIIDTMPAVRTSWVCVIKHG